MRTRRRRRLVWFPTRYDDDNDPDKLCTIRRSTIGVGVAQRDAFLNIHSIIQDNPVEAESFLDDAIGALPVILMANEYFIRRIVGKFFCSIVSKNTTAASCVVTMGLFIARQDSGEAPALDLPVGALTQAIQLYDPANPNTTREPWIWRRQWQLSNALHPSDFGDGNGPATNRTCGSVLDGPHVDAKTMRKVSQGDRLWMAVSTRPFGGIGTAEGEVAYEWDFRVLGNLRQQRPSGKF